MLTSFLAVAILHWAILVSPGPNVLLVSQLAAGGHRRAATLAGLGVSVVALVWSSLAILGVHAVFVAHPMLRLGLQLAGGLYLCWLGWRLWRAGGAQRAGRAPELSAPAAFRLGFLTNIMNPKSALFFGSVFATSLPDQADKPLMAAILLMVFANAVAWHLFLAVAFSHPAIQSAYGRQRKLLNRLAATMVTAFGCRLLAAVLVSLKDEWRAHVRAS